jgi:hypothetical protein
MAARERLRQLALWSPAPILVYLNCGLPYGMEKQMETEVAIFQKENVLRLWQYENERAFSDSLAAFINKPPHVVKDSEYQGIIRFVDSRLENSIPDLKDLGFANMEGMILEEVVLRRRFFSQAISGALGANVLADSTLHIDLYSNQSRILTQVGDTLEQFFSTINVPSLVLLEAEAFLRLREKSQAVLPEIVDEIFERTATGQATQSEIVQRLVGKYEAELLELVKKITGASAKQTIEAFGQGVRTQIESRLALFYLSDPISDLTPWFSQTSDGSCRLALLLLEWKAGKFGLDFRY